MIYYYILKLEGAGLIILRFPLFYPVLFLFFPNRHYDLAEENHLPEIVNECKQFLCSEQWFLTLSNLTGLTLHKLAADVRASSDSETDESPDAAQGGSTAGSSGDAVPDEDRGGIENDVPEKRRKQEKTSKEEDGGEGSTGSKGKKKK